VRPTGRFCYTLSGAECAGGYTHVEYVSGLALCQMVGGDCVPLHVSQAALLAAGGCMHRLRMPSALPPAPSPPPSLPSAPPSPSPTAASPTAAPCVPLSGKCGGATWNGPTVCCAHSGDANVSCYRKNALLSQCRTSCLSDWECAAAAPGSSSNGRADHSSASNMGTWKASPPSAVVLPAVRSSAAASDVPTGKVAALHGGAAGGHATDQTPQLGGMQLPDEGEGEQVDGVHWGFLYSCSNTEVYLAAVLLLLLCGNSVGCFLVCCCCLNGESHRGYVYSKDVLTTEDVEPASATSKEWW